jgi:hypothetical protein
VDRVCGASIERDRLSQSRCWCRGLFCGRGGARLSAELRRDFKVKGHAASRAQFDDFTRQPDMFDGEAKREKWQTRLDSRFAAPTRSRSAVMQKGQSHVA